MDSNPRYSKSMVDLVELLLGKKMKQTYREAFILKHGKAAYAEKLVKNATWRKANPKKAEEYAEKRSKKAGKNENTLLLISDVHVGASTVDVDAIKALARKYWSKNPIALLGDLCDLGLDRGMEFDQKYGPQKQVDLVEEIFKPLDIRVYVTGNHENRIFAKVGLTPFISIFGMQPSNTFKINNRKIFINHGKSAAENMFLEFQKYVKYVDADLIGLGHSHDLARITYMRGEKLQHLVRTGSFLGRPRYVVNAGFAPKIPGWAEYNTVTNVVNLKAWNPDTGEVFNI